MDNGNLNPVAVYKGGWNCRHSLVPVNPDWDADLAARIAVGEEAIIPISKDGRRTITIIQ
jgi:hypothetical protein